MAAVVPELWRAQSGWTAAGSGVVPWSWAAVKVRCGEVARPDCNYMYLFKRLMVADLSALPCRLSSDAFQERFRFV